MNNYLHTQTSPSPKTTSSCELTKYYKQLKHIILHNTTDKNRKLTKARGMKITQLLDETYKLLKYFFIKQGVTEGSKMLIQSEEDREVFFTPSLNSDETLLKDMLDDFNQVEHVKKQECTPIDHKNIVINELIDNKTINIDTTEKFINIILPGYSCQIIINTKC